MTATVHRPTVEQWQQRITEQLAVVRAARAQYEHSPNGFNAERIKVAEQRLDYLQDQWARAQIQAQADEIAEGRAGL